MKIYCKMIFIAVCSLFLVGWSFGDKKPKKGELEIAFEKYLPGYTHLTKFDVEILENMGTKVDPRWGSRFKAVVKTKVPLYALDQKDKRKDITFVTLKSKQGTTTEIYGKIISTTYQGKWKHGIDVEGGPIKNLGTLLDQFQGKRVLVRGSQEEKSYYAEVKKHEIVLYKGKMWQQADDGKNRKWAEANTYCQNLMLGGYDDWRLPTNDELTSLVVCNVKEKPQIDLVHGKVRVCGSVGFGKPSRLFIDPIFSCGRGYYWAAEKRGEYGQKEIWVIDFHYAILRRIRGREKERSGYMTRCVRGGW